LVWILPLFTQKNAKFFEEVKIASRGARQMEGLSPRSRRASTGSDQSKGAILEKLTKCADKSLLEKKNI